VSPNVNIDEAENRVIYDFDANGRVVGLEFLNASDMLGDPSELEDSLKSSARKKSKPADAPVNRYEPCVA